MQHIPALRRGCHESQRGRSARGAGCQLVIES
jgi:hypothetical protein